MHTYNDRARSRGKEATASRLSYRHVLYAITLARVPLMPSRCSEPSLQSIVMKQLRRAPRENRSPLPFSLPSCRCRPLLPGGPAGSVSRARPSTRATIRSRVVHVKSKRASRRRAEDKLALHTYSRAHRTGAIETARQRCRVAFRDKHTSSLYHAMTGMFAS